MVKIEVPPAYELPCVYNGVTNSEQNIRSRWEAGAYKYGLPHVER
jgi:hypothetical protein